RTGRSRGARSTPPARGGAARPTPGTGSRSARSGGPRCSRGSTGRWRGRRSWSAPRTDERDPTAPLRPRPLARLRAPPGHDVARLDIDAQTAPAGLAFRTVDPERLYFWGLVGVAI